jgi:hypothetical protein
MNGRFRAILMVTGIVALEIATSALANPTAQVYPGDLKVVMKIGSALYDTLDAKYQDALEPSPVMVLPLAAPAMAPTENNASRQVAISTGFIALLDRIAHAKAIDRIEPGYFDQYVAMLGENFGDENPPELPAIDNPRYWSSAIMNEQSGFFNQMVGLTLAINLSHHYLGSYDKYSSAMTGQFAPINDFLTAEEWESGVKAAAENALECAFATDGGKALFEAIGKMPRRPAWTAYIVPQNINIKELNAKLAQYEWQFFHGDHDRTLSQVWKFRRN